MNDMIENIIISKPSKKLEKFLEILKEKKEERKQEILKKEPDYIIFVK